MSSSEMLPTGLFCASLIACRMLSCKKLHDSLENARVLLAVDVGSSSVRCTAFRVDEDEQRAVLVPGCASTHTAQNVVDGVADCLELFQLINHVVSECLYCLHARGVKSVHSIGITTFAMTLVGVDSQTGLPMTPMFTYAGQGSDVNSAAELIMKEVPYVDQQLHYHKTGTVLHHPCYAAAQLQNYMKSADNDDFKSLSWTTLSGFVIGQWSGLGVKAPISLSDAAWTGLMNMHTMEWDATALRYLGLNLKKFAPISRNSTLLVKRGVFFEGLGAISAKLMQNTRLFLGIGDGFAATIGSRCRCRVDAPEHNRTRKGTSKNLSITIGTSAAARFIAPFIDVIPLENVSGVFAYRVSEHEVLVGGSLTDAGSLVGWLSRIVGEDRLSELIKEAESKYLTDIDEYIESPLVLPFWSGERCTGWNFDARGMIDGLTHRTSSHQILFGLMDGVMMRLREIVVRLNVILCREGCINRSDADVTISPIDAIVGSGAVLEKGWIWRQMLSDITGLPVVIIKKINGETTLNGLALHMLYGHLNSFEESNTFREQQTEVFGFRKDLLEEVHYPNERNGTLVLKRYQRIVKLYEKHQHNSS